MGQGNFEDSPPSNHQTEILSPPDVIINTKNEDSIIVHSQTAKKKIISQEPEEGSSSESSDESIQEQVEAISKEAKESIPEQEKTNSAEESTLEAQVNSLETAKAESVNEERIPDNSTELDKEVNIDDTRQRGSSFVSKEDITNVESYSEDVQMQDLKPKTESDISATDINTIVVQPKPGSTPPPPLPEKNYNDLSTTCSQITKFEINTLLPTLGEFGTFQKLLNAILFLVCLPSVYQVLIMYFATLTPPWKCAENSTICTSNFTHLPDDHGRCTMNRTDWYYTEHKSYSLVTQFDLHCDEEWKLNLASSIIFFGWGLGSIMCGWLGDRYGRKSVFLPSVGAVLTVGFLTIFCTDIYQISACQFIIGFFIPGVQLQAFILISEFVGDKQRALAGILIILTDPVSWCILAVKAYFIQNWKTLSMVSTLPYLFVFLFYKFIPESITWLHFHGKTDRVRETARQVAKWNKTELPENFEVVGTHEGGAENVDGSAAAAKTSPGDLFGTKRDTMLSIVQGFLWLVTACCYFGLHMASNDLGGSIYRDFIILNLVEFPAVFVAVTGCNRIGRKFTSLFSLCCGSISCITLAFLPTVGPYKIARIALGITGEFCLSITFNALYTWSVEIYDLPVRNKGMAWLQIISRLGSAGAPWMVKGLKPVKSWLPFVALGSPALIGSIVSIWLPETKNFKKKYNNSRKVEPTAPTRDYIVENEHTV